MDENENKSLEEALGRFLDGEPEAQDGDDLGKALKKDPKLGREVTGLLMVDQLLRHHAEPHTDSFLDALQTRVDAEAEGEAFAEKLERTDRARSREGGWIPWLVAAAAALIAIVAWTRSPATEPSDPVKPSGVVALLVDEAGAVYRKGHEPDHVRFAKGSYELVEGTAHLRLVNGVDLVIPAPARFSLEGPLALELQAGRLRVIVPEQGRGFTVRTPFATFEDFGTEFGIGVDGATGDSELHVFQGRVDVKGARDGASLASVELGESVTVTGGKVAPADPPVAGVFPTPDSIGTRRWQQAQEARRSDPDLVFYYPFIRESNDAVLRDHAADGTRLDARIVGARWVTGRWTGKQALLFDREEDAVVIDIPGEFDAFTMAAWVKVDRLDYELNAVFDSDGWEGGDVHWQLNRHGQLLFGPFTGASKSRPAAVEISPGDWTHVALVLDRAAGHAVSYINGRGDAIYTLEPDGRYAPGPSRIGNWLKRPDYKHVLKRGFAGRMDEFAMWRRALSAKEIQGLVEEGRPSVLWGTPTGADQKR